MAEVEVDKMFCLCGWSVVGFGRICLCRAVPFLSFRVKQKLESIKAEKEFAEERTVGYEAAEVTANDAVPSGTFSLVKL